MPIRASGKPENKMYPVEFFRIFITLVLLTIFSQGSFAYSPTTTHAGLSQEIVTFYESEQGDIFTEAEGELIIQASIDEDNPPTRAVNHFYDPISGKGINNYRNAYDWATNELGGNEFYWKAGIEAYAKGDTRTGLIVLGHVLHLLEDSSVPDHTRNDPHKGEGIEGLYTGTSPFEDWAHKEKTRATMQGYANQIRAEGYLSDICYDKKECFDTLALYSNQNFFSADTIAQSKYADPKISEVDDFYAYGVDKLTQKKVKLYILLSSDKSEQQALLQDRDNNSILEEYFSRLAPRTISVGAKVVDLYMTEAKFARAEYLKEQDDARRSAIQEEERLNTELSGAGWFTQLRFGFREIFVKKPIAVVTHVSGKLASASENFLISYTTVFGEAVHVIDATRASSGRASVFVANKTQESAKQAYLEVNIATKNAGEKIMTEAEKLAELAVKLIEMKAILERYAKESAHSQLATTYIPIGEVLGVSTTTETVSIVDTVPSVSIRIDEGIPQGSAPATPALTTPPVSDTTAPDAPIILEPSDVTTILATTTLALAGTAEANSTIAIVVTNATTSLFLTPTDSTGIWSIPLFLSEGTTTLELVAIDEVGNMSATTTATLVVRIPLLVPEPRHVTCSSLLYSNNSIEPASPPDPLLFVRPTQWNVEGDTPTAKVNIETVTIWAKLSSAFFSVGDNAQVNVGGVFFNHSIIKSDLDVAQPITFNGSFTTSAGNNFFIDTWTTGGMGRFDNPSRIYGSVADSYLGPLSYALSSDNITPIGLADLWFEVCGIEISSAPEGE